MAVSELSRKQQESQWDENRVHGGSCQISLRGIRKLRKSGHYYYWIDEKVGISVLIKDTRGCRNKPQAHLGFTQTFIGDVLWLKYLSRH